MVFELSNVLSRRRVFQAIAVQQGLHRIHVGLLAVRNVMENMQTPLRPAS
jgi:hypothetical protein